MAQATQAQNPSARKPLTQERLKELFDYNPETGLFTRIKGLNAKGASCGVVAGSFDKSTGYLTISVDRRRRYVHRIAWLYMTGEEPPRMIDHENRNRTDNRWSNLRAATPSGNVANATLSKANTSGFKGVSWVPEKQVFRAYISKNRRQIWLGYYQTAELAAEARRKAAMEIHGDFACAG